MYQVQNIKIVLFMNRDERDRDIDKLFFRDGGISKAWIPENVFNSKIINNEP